MEDFFSFFWKYLQYHFLSFRLCFCILLLLLLWLWLCYGGGGLVDISWYRFDAPLIFSWKFLTAKRRSILRKIYEEMSKHRRIEKVFSLLKFLKTIEQLNNFSSPNNRNSPKLNSFHQKLRNFPALPSSFPPAVVFRRWRVSRRFLDVAHGLPLFFSSLERRGGGGGRTGTRAKPTKRG